MPFWDHCYYPKQERGGAREAFRLLIMKFYCSLERLLANHNTYARAHAQISCRKPWFSLCRPASVSGAAAEHGELGWLGGTRRQPGLRQGKANPPGAAA